MLRISALLFAALVVRGVRGETPVATEKKSCCTTISSRTTLLAAASTAAYAAGVETVKGNATDASNVSTKGWPAKPWPEGKTAGQ